MSNADARHQRIPVLSADGVLLGHWRKAYETANWRVLGRKPSVILGSGERRTLEKVDDAWCFRLRPGEKRPTLHFEAVNTAA